jgi:Haem-binding domain
MISPHSTLLKAALSAVTVGSVLAVALTTWNANSVASAPAGHRPLLAGSQVPTSVLSTVARACQDCHSANTHWPWYSKFPPLSWKIHKDVAQGRAFMDLSKWNEYTDSERKGYLAAIVAATQTHLMPPANYARLHREARLWLFILGGLNQRTQGSEHLHRAKRKKQKIVRYVKPKVSSDCDMWRRNEVFELFYSELDE